MNRMHRVVRAFTFGKVGWTAANMPVLELTTIGRTSGEPRTVLLTAPVAMGESHVIVASKGGHPAHPAWYLNLLENPNVTVTTEHSVFGGAVIDPVHGCCERWRRGLKWRASVYHQ